MLLAQRESERPHLSDGDAVPHTAKGTVIQMLSKVSFRQNHADTLFLQTYLRVFNINLHMNIKHRQDSLEENLMGEDPHF